MKQIINVLTVHPEASDPKLQKAIAEHNGEIEAIKHGADDVDREKLIAECTAAEIAERKQQHFFAAFDRLRELARLCSQARSLYKELLIEARAARDTAERGLTAAEKKATAQLAKVGITVEAMPSAPHNINTARIQLRNQHLVRTETYRQARAAVNDADAQIGTLQGYVSRIGEAEASVNSELLRGFDRL